MQKTPATVCALYTCVSSQNQLDTDYNSMQTQRERLESYCRSQDNYSIYRVYEDGAYSAETLDRPALKQMIHDIRAGKVNCVLAYKIDRLTRSVKDFHLLMDLFDKHHVKFVSITQSLDTQHPMGRLLRNILLDFAQFEREMTADRTRDKMHQRAQKGMWNGGGVPYGYRNENKRLVPDDVEAPRVQFIFAQFAQNPSLSNLRVQLRQRNWLTRSNRPWTKSPLDYMLSNPVYIGKLAFNDLNLPGEHKPIIEEALFQRVQAHPRQRQHAARDHHRPFLLKGLLTCNHCGSAMTPHYSQKRRKDGSVHRVCYYRCTKTMKYDNSICKIKQLNADRAEASVVDNLFDLASNEAAVEATVAELNRDLQTRVQPLEKEAGEIQRRLTELDAEIDRFVGAVGQGTISVARLEKEIAQRQTDQKALRAQYDKLQQSVREQTACDCNAELVKRNLREFRNVFRALTPDEKMQALQCLLKQITVLPDKLVLEVFELADFAEGSKNRSNWLQR